MIFLSFKNKCVIYKFSIQVAVAEVNFPSWAKAVDLMYPRAIKMTLKPRHILVNRLILFLIIFSNIVNLY